MTQLGSTAAPWRGGAVSAFARSFRRVVRWRERGAVEVRGVVAEPAARDGFPPFDIAPDDPLLAFCAASSGALMVDQLDLDSAALRAMREAGVQVVVPLVSQGELIGLLNLGARLSERGYSGDDRKLLEELATHAAPAIRVAQLVRQQEAEARERERVQQELRVATLIQQQFLPKELPHLQGWQVAAYYQSAREVGGDFYDFFPLPDGRVGIVVGDVTDKGVPAALVMATTHSLLRAEAPRLVDPGTVLERVNDLLVAEMPPNMFVTCLYAVLDPATGALRIANAGHNLPYVARDGGAVELRVRGLPLGLLPGMAYEEVEATLERGESMLLHSDGIAEAHDPTRDMFGFPRLRAIVGEGLAGRPLIDRILAELGRFTGPGWLQEDDITLVSLHRAGQPVIAASQQTAPAGAVPEPPAHAAEVPQSADRSGDVLLAELAVPSAPGNERDVMERVGAELAGRVAPARLERLKTAVAEATMNAIEHGNGLREDLDVEVALLASHGAVVVRITDHGGAAGVGVLEQAVAPDLEAKLAGLQPARGWGLFLIKSMVDDVSTTVDGDRHTVELVLRTEGESDASQPA